MMVILPLYPERIFSLKIGLTAWLRTQDSSLNLYWFYQKHQGLQSLLDLDIVFSELHKVEKEIWSNVSLHLYTT
jgi:hypothetical protein